MKHELFFAILSTILSPLPGETGSYHKHTWKNEWVNVSRDTPIINYQTSNRLYVGTLGMVNNTEKVILRVDRYGSKLDNDRYIIDYSVNVECAKKEATYTHVLYRNIPNKILSTVKIEKTEAEKFDDSHLFGVICAARALTDVLVNRQVKTFDTCDFRQQQNGVNAVKFDGLIYNFPIRWNLETCKAVKNAVWLYGAGQDEAARTRLAWAPPLAILVDQYMCKFNCGNYRLTRLFVPQHNF
jgi:hypothetical protein